MTKKKSGNKAWIVGTVLGAVAGAAYALWKTPMSGQELRTKLAPGPIGQRDDVATNTVHQPGIGDTILGKVEQTLAPVVGVKLGKTANGPAPTNGSVTEPITVSEPTPDTSPVAAQVATPAEASQEAVDPTPKVMPEADPVQASDPPAATVEYGTDSIRAKRFAWGSPTPEAGIQPVPVEPVAQPIVAVPDPVPEPVAVASSPKNETTSTYGQERIGTSGRFAWGEPAPNDVAAATAEQPTAEVESVSDSRPLEPVSAEAAIPGSNMRKFPKLGGLENN